MNNTEKLLDKKIVSDADAKERGNADVIPTAKGELAKQRSAAEKVWKALPKDKKDLTYALREVDTSEPPPPQLNEEGDED